MKRFCRSLAWLLVLALALGVCGVAGAVTWEFGTSGQNQNPFTPRGFAVDTGSGVQWLRSRFDNSGPNIAYNEAPTYNGLSYIDAAQQGANGYTFYALTDRNPKVYNYLVAYKDGVKLENFASCAQAPGRAYDIDPSGDYGMDASGQGKTWAIPIVGFVLEPGCLYEFAFQQGLQANNGITLVFSEDGKGYIQNPETAEERAKYEADKYKEYEFVSSWEKLEDGSVEFHTVPMRFTLQTYADLSLWDILKVAAQEMISGESGVYAPEGIENLKALLYSLEERAQNEVKRMLQPQADEAILQMATQLEAAMEAAESQQGSVDLAAYNAALGSAKTLYRIASGDIGQELGQYGSQEAVDGLGDCIAQCEGSITGASAQVAVNDATDALVAATERVKASKVRAPSRTLLDEATGIAAIIPEGALPQTAQLYITRIEEGDTEGIHAVFKDSLGENGAYTALYRIEFLLGDQRIQPTQAVQIQIPLPDWEHAAAVSVYSATPEGTPTPLPFSSPAGYRVFDMTENGLYGIASAQGAKQPDEPTQSPLPSDDPASSPVGTQSAPATSTPVSAVDGGQGDAAGGSSGGDNNANGASGSDPQSAASDADAPDAPEADQDTQTVIKETEEQVNDTPLSQQLLEPTQTTQPQAVESKTQAVKRSNPDAVRIPQEELLRTGNPAFALYIAIVLAVAALALGGAEWFKYKRKGGKNFPFPPAQHPPNRARSHPQGGAVGAQWPTLCGIGHRALCNRIPPRRRYP